VVGNGLDGEVRLAVYRHFVERGRAPVPAEIGDDLGVAQAEVEEALHRLAADHLLVLAPGTPYVWMANPFSALPTAYAVQADGKEWFGNCIWDALGILALLGSDGVVTTRCTDCGDVLTVEVADGELRDPTGVVHYAIPASRWWDDIGFN
jgi:hypothetical protein